MQNISYYPAFAQVVKLWKILLLAAACMLVFGILLTAGSAIAIRSTGASWIDGIAINSASVENRRYELNSIDSLSLSLVNEPIYIVRGGNSVIIEWSELYDGQYRLVAQEGQALSLSRQTRWSLFSFEWGRNRASLRPVTVTIPEDMELSSVNLRGANIRVDMENISAEKVDISGANTTVSLRNIEALEIDISGANTAVTLSDISTNNIEVRGANAVVTLSDIFANHIEVNGANAEATLTLSNLDDWTLNVSGANARLRIDGQRAFTSSGSGANTITVSGANANMNVWTG